MADIIAAVLNELLGDIGILQEEGISVSYYEHEDIFDTDNPGEPIGNRIKYYPDYDESLDIKSLMWTIPFGQTITIPIPGLNFKLPPGKSAACVFHCFIFKSTLPHLLFITTELPLTFEVKDNEPVLIVEWQFKLAFGFDEDDGFFLYTFPEGKEIQFVGMFVLFMFL